MSGGPPEGTRFVLPAAAARRAGVLARLHDLYRSWGYEPVEVPALERYDPSHPRAGQSFKLSDRDSGVLALRADFTPALAELVRRTHPAVARGAARALRYQYAGSVWHAIDPELARTREFTQVGIELIGVSNARADAELIHLARESVRTVGLTPRVEVGNPGFVRTVLGESDVPLGLQAAFADAIERKDRSDLAQLLGPLRVGEEAQRAVMALPDLYGGIETLQAARRSVSWPTAHRELDRIAGALREFEDDSDLMVDLSMARRLSYYTGLTFRAYTPDFGQALLGGGRYDGALLPAAAGFTIGLERLMRASERLGNGDEGAPSVLSLDDPAARILRRAGVRVVRALTGEVEAARLEARERGIPFLVVAGSVEPVGDPPEPAAAGLEQLQALLDAAGEAPSG